MHDKAAAVAGGNGNGGRKDKNKITCFNCQGKGHYANECRKPHREQGQGQNQEANNIDHFFIANAEQCHTITVAEQVEDEDLYVPWSFEVYSDSEPSVMVGDEDEDSIEFIDTKK